MIAGKIPTLAIITVNWNAGDQLEKAVKSVLSSRIENFTLEKMIIVDNGSTDDSLKLVEELDIGESVKIIKSGKNLGFGKACNLAVSTSVADYFLFLNPDTILNEDTLETGMKLIKEKRGDGIRVLSFKQVDGKGNVQKHCARFPNGGRFILKSLFLDRVFPFIKDHFLSEWDHKTDRVVDQVMGAFMLMDAELFRSLGGFDERYFMYFEDVDLALRIHKQGFRSLYSVKSSFYHRGEGTTWRIKDKQLFYILQSRIRYYLKHSSLPVALGNLLSALTLEFASRIALSAYVAGVKGIMDTLKGYLLFYRTLPETLGLRR